MDLAKIETEKHPNDRTRWPRQAVWRSTLMTKRMEATTRSCSLAMEIWNWSIHRKCNATFESTWIEGCDSNLYNPYLHIRYYTLMHAFLSHVNYIYGLLSCSFILHFSCPTRRQHSILSNSPQNRLWIPSFDPLLCHGGRLLPMFFHLHFQCTTFTCVTLRLLEENTDFILLVPMTRLITATRIDQEVNSIRLIWFPLFPAGISAF